MDRSARCDDCIVSSILSVLHAIKTMQVVVPGAEVADVRPVAEDAIAELDQGASIAGVKGLINIRKQELQKVLFEQKQRQSEAR